MKKTSMIKASLLGSASALGLNWIYDRELLEEYSKDNNVLFNPIDPVLYDKAKTSFNVYPGFLPGDVDFMGEILFLFHMFLRFNKDKSIANWRQVVYDHVNPNGDYNGYIEHYGIDIIEKMDMEKAKGLEPKLFTDHEDKQLIGPALMLAMFENSKSLNKVHDTMDYARVFTKYENIQPFNDLLFNLLNDLTNKVDKLTALEDNLNFAPNVYKKSLKAALTETDLSSFIKEHSGVACGLEQSFPLIYFIVAHYDTWEDALTINSALGGASSSRGLFLGAIFNILDGVPEKFVDLLKHQV